MHTHEAYNKYEFYNKKLKQELFDLQMCDLRTMIVMQDIVPANPLTLATLHQTLQGWYWRGLEDPRNGSSFQLVFEPPFLPTCQRLLILLVGVFSKRTCHFLLRCCKKYFRYLKLFYITKLNGRRMLFKKILCES